MTEVDHATRQLEELAAACAAVVPAEVREEIQTEVAEAVRLILKRLSEANPNP